MRIPTLLQKIADLASRPEQRTAIDVDLMLDYTRVLYADLLEWRAKLPAGLATPSVAPVKKEPTLAELAAAMEQSEQEEAAPIVRVPERIDRPIPKQEPTPQAQAPKERYERPVFSQQVAGAGEAKPVAKDIRSLISINDKYQIMSELFGNDKRAYEQAIDYINQSKSEAATLQWLREQLWITEEHSDAAQSFYDIVARYYRS